MKSNQEINTNGGITTILTHHEQNLIWIDMEMTGLIPENDRIIEVAVIVTDAKLECMVTGPVIAIHQDSSILDVMDDWNQSTHKRSGLLDRVKASRINESIAMSELISFLKDYIPQGKSPMCGNSICQDRRFMARWMPELENFFHYRNLDVSTLRELAKRWKPEIVKGFTKRSQHTALADIEESIEELKYYREHFINLTCTESS